MSSTRIEPLGSGVREGVEKDGDYAPAKERKKLKVEGPKATSPVVEVEGEEKHQLDERA